MTRKKFIKMYTAFIQCAIRLNEKAGKYGVSSLEDEVYDLVDSDLRTGLRFVAEETNPAIIDEIFSNKISFEKDKYIRQLLIIKKRAVLGIQKQESTRVLYYVLNSYANLTSKESNYIDYIIFNDVSDSDDIDTN